ncbi:MAG: hypothetical protein ACYCU7_08065 [Acidimicrobiales bacterium]
MTILSSQAHTFEDADEALEACFELGWTDGLPVVPATAERVEAMLAAGGAVPGDVLGEVPTRRVTVTAEKAAVNAVMAGCRPEYFPVVLAAVRAFLQTKANAHSTTATLAGAAHAVIVNGPARRRLGIESGQACFGPGFRANATIGRALRLVIRNVCRAVPGELDRATFSWPLRYSFCFGENEEASDWTPLHVQLGYRADQSVVTVQSVMRLVQVTDFHPEPTAILDAIAEHARFGGLQRDEWAGDDRSIVVVVGTEHHLRLLDAGYSKEKVQEALWPILTADTAGKYDNKLHLASPANVMVVAAGGPGIAQSWVVVPHLAVPTHQAVEWPAGDATPGAAAGDLLSPGARAVLDELDGIVAADGARLVLRSAGGSVVALALDLSGSTCPECVLPKDLLVEMLTGRLSAVDPDITEVRLDDPREGETPSVTR